MTKDKVHLFLIGNRNGRRRVHQDHRAQEETGTEDLEVVDHPTGTEDTMVAYHRAMEEGQTTPHTREASPQEEAEGDFHQAVAVEEEVVLQEEWDRSFFRLMTMLWTPH